MHPVDPDESPGVHARPSLPGPFGVSSRRAVPVALSGRGVEKRAEIARRAAEIFARQGAARTSLEDIATAAGVKREGVYYYFRDKWEILHEIIRPQSDALLRSMERLASLNMAPTARLALAIGSHLQRFNPTYIEMTVALRELQGSDPAPEMIALRRVWKEYERHWITLFRQGQEAGEFAREQDPKVMAFAILGMCNAVSGWYQPGGEIAIEDLVRSYTAIALQGVAGAGRARTGRTPRKPAR